MSSLLSVVGVCMIITILFACDSRSDSEYVDVNMVEVTGLIEDVQYESLLKLDYLTLRSSTGLLFKFKGPDKIVPGFTPSHLRDHMVLGLPVTVTFHSEMDALIIKTITD